MIYGSVCSGIEAATVAWEPLGWRAAWFSEIEAWPSAVLAHHYPRVPNMGDMTKLPALVRARLIAAPDVLVGGTPCQAYSLAGLRGGLTDPRGQLTLTFVDLANAIDEQRPDDECVIYWENVPGVLSDSTNAFGCFLAGLAGETDPLVAPGGKWPNAGLVVGPQRAIAWRVTDAQYFGVAQRRRRLFVAASARDGFDPGKLLFEFDGVRRDIAPSREAGEEVTGTLASRSNGGGFPGSDESCSGFVRAVAVCPTLRAGGNTTGGRWPPGTDVDTADSPICVPVLECASNAEGSPGLPFLTCSNLAKGVNNQTPLLAFSCKDYGADASLGIAPTMRAMGHSGSHQNGGGQLAVCVTGSVTHCLKAEGFDASEDGTGRGQPITAVAYRVHGENSTAMTGNGNANVADPVEVARCLDTCGGYAANQGGNVVLQQLQTIWRVRRLTPRECERLQAFPDDYTLVPYRGKPSADGPRYKGLGNSMCVLNMRWLALRLLASHPALFMAKIPIDAAVI